MKNIITRQEKYKTVGNSIMFLFHVGMSYTYWKFSGSVLGLSFFFLTWRFPTHQKMYGNVS